ncbi:LLM class flavin-dependent oxidoreductase [Amycolatopsis thermoflava]|uniref:LLM class flavin-dependent oxidoreductase n=1 Tax=Amycolatopsis thermoflava TaxID=84480 RepID=UPI0009FE4650|nr:LLM class flavin-dependent oxidoreductase [Amycolatopsis thermoflava]
MRFGVLYDLRNPARPDWHRPWSQFYSGAFEHMQEMEHVGFDAVSLSEHHGDPDGYNPGLPVTLTAAAHHTSRIRIGTNIIQVPFYHPVLLAEQLAVIDILSGGRLDVGLGQVGPTFNMEFPMLGVNPKFRPSLLDEGIDIMRRCWSSDEPFSYHGKRWHLDDVWINPKPIQKPLPVWVVAAFSAAVMDRVAKRGLNVGGLGGFFQGLTGGQTWQKWLAGWREACVRNGRQPNYAKIHTFGTCYITDDPERAWAKHRGGIFEHFHYRRGDVHPYSSLLMDVPPTKPEDIPNWERIFQTPGQAITELRATYEEGGPDELHLMATRHGMTWEESAGYLRNFAEKVLPAVRDL